MEKEQKPNTPSKNLFPVVGIGASAGGLDAFKRLLKAIPENSGLAYVLVQHLDPNHESMLPEILQKVTIIPVLEISDDIKVQPNHIYILPSNKMLIANDGVLELSPRSTKKNERNLPIDLFFSSLAEIHQSHALGVVLSGTGSDGTKGLRAIKDHGGITFAQDEESAAYEGMPNSAVQSGAVDFILSPEDMPQKLMDLTSNILKNEVNLLEAESARGVLPQILTLLRIRKGTDFTHYKQTTIGRRIIRRMALNKIEDHSGYLKFLREDKNEQDLLYQDLLIPVTAFFRDTNSFNKLCETVLPLLADSKNIDEPIRVWVAGCSTGQEAYSIAICLKEFLASNDPLNTMRKVQIFATDISEPAITRARTGIYSAIEIEGVSPQRLQDYFTKNNGHYQVHKHVREVIVFAVHNFLREPPFGKMDFISCRNVLIYMEPYLQKKALTTFHYALNPKGFLWLGKAETISGVPELFMAYEKHDKMFSRKDVPGRFMHITSDRSEQNLRVLSSGLKSVSTRNDFQVIADEIMLVKYTPAGVVVNESMDIVHFRGLTGKYLEQVAGKPSHNLLLMAKEGLAFELRNILHKVKKGNIHAIKENVPVMVDGTMQNITIEAFPLPEAIDPHFLVLFHDNFSTGNPTEGKKTRKPTVGNQDFDDRDLRIQLLEKELAQSRADMRSITEDQEAVNEELQSANEELLSGSEELQSLNEELESSKEELQSTNEELTVVNQEMVSLNEQVTDSKDFAEAILANLRTPLLVLNQYLRIKSANTAFYKTFQINELETEGKLIYEISNRDWDIENLRKLLEQILPEQSKITDYEVRHNFKSIGERIMLLNAQEIRIEKDTGKSILLSIEDITERTLFFQKEKELLNRFHNIVKQAPVSISIMRGADFIVEMANDPFLQMIEKEENDFVGLPLFLALPHSRSIVEPILLEVLKSGQPHYANELELNINRFGSPQRCFFNFVYQPLREVNGSINSIICIATEVTELVVARKNREVQATMVETLLMTAPAFVCTMNGPDHVYDLVNERFQQLFGKRKIQGKPIMEALPELEGQGIDTLLDKIYTTGETFVGIEVPITLARDVNLAPEVRYFNFSYQPIFDGFKNIYSILVFGYEVTEQVLSKNKNLEDQQLRALQLEELVRERTYEILDTNETLQEKNKELVSINKELHSFTYISSHDLQEPLRKIQTFATRILEKENQNLSDTGKDYFRRMQESANRMQKLIVDLLAFSRLRTIDRKFELEDLVEIVNEVIMELDQNIQQKQATIEVGKLCDAYINPFQFRQLMNNLICNSLKFSSPDRRPHISIKSEIVIGNSLNYDKHSLKKNYCQITVTDNGIGFKPEYKERIFELFQRLHSRDEFEGTGIGLSIVKKIVENHKGYITATGEVGVGATFKIFLPTI